MKTKQINTIIDIEPIDAYILTDELLCKFWDSVKTMIEDDLTETDGCVIIPINGRFYKCEFGVKLNLSGLNINVSYTTKSIVKITTDQYLDTIIEIKKKQ